MARKATQTVEAKASAPAPVEVEAEKRGRGRPRKDTTMKMYPVHFYMPNREALEHLQEAAAAEGMNLSQWARFILGKRANEVLGG